MMMALCIPCVKNMEPEHKVTRLSGNSVKDRCQCCGRMRYCGRWDVAANPTKKGGKA